MRFAPIILIILAVALQWYGHEGRLLDTDDSCNYISASISFKTSFQFLSPDGTNYTYWPPLYPIFLSVFGPYLYWINLVLVAIIGWLIIDYVKKFIEDPWLQIVCQASIILSVHLLMIGVFIWSELLFLLLLILFVKAVEKNFIAAIIIGFLLCLQRNAGIFFVIAAALWYWDLRKSLLLFLISTSGCIAWNIYFYSAAAGERQYFLDIPNNFNVIATGLMHSIAPLPGFLFLVVIGVVAYLLRSEQKIRLMALMLLVYIAGISALFFMIEWDADRYASVVLPFLMILIFRAFEKALAGQTSTVRKVLLILVICWLAYPFSRTLKNAVQWHNVSFTSYFCAIQF
jgi:hypothetical protein